MSCYIIVGRIIAYIGFKHVAAGIAERSAAGNKNCEICISPVCGKQTDGGRHQTYLIFSVIGECFRCAPADGNVKARNRRCKRAAELFMIGNARYAEGICNALRCVCNLRHSFRPAAVHIKLQFIFHGRNLFSAVIHSINRYSIQNIMCRRIISSAVTGSRHCEGGGRNFKRRACAHRGIVRRFGNGCADHIVAHFGRASCKRVFKRRVALKIVLISDLRLLYLLGKRIVVLYRGRI